MFIRASVTDLQSIFFLTTCYTLKNCIIFCDRSFEKPRMLYKLFLMFIPHVNQKESCWALRQADSDALMSN